MASSAQKAVILVSGGLDSATALAIARHEGFECFALTFDYQQRHRVELTAARAVAKSMGVQDHKIISIDLRAWGGSALTADIDVPKDQVTNDIPITYVPARNTIFLSFALGYAETIACTDIFIGVNAIDYSGYPDCRPEFIEAFERTANLATKMGVEGNRIRIYTPLIDLTKAQIIQRGHELGVDFSLTWSCYDPVENPSGPLPCGRCDSCLLRIAGFRDAGIPEH